jgi:tetratricopeptide (TPR) repeat protein
VIVVLSLFLSGAGLIKALMRGVLWMVVLKYSFESLKATAGGNLIPPAISSKTISDDIQQVLKQFVIYIILFFAFGYFSATIGPFIGFVFLLGALFFVPAMIILLVTSSSLFQAINPVAFVGLAFRIGWAYLLMNFFLFLLGSAPAFLAQYIIRIFPPGLDLLLFNFAKSFYTVVSYHLMGYVILQYHEKIGYRVDYEDFRDPAAEVYEPQEVDPDAAILNAVNPLIQEGKLDEAVALIKERTKQVGIKGVNLSERYYNLLKMRKRTSEMLVHGINYLGLLTAENHKSKAVKVYLECLKLKPEFLPGAPALFKLGGWLSENGKTKEALAAYNRLVKGYPQNPIVPKAYFRVAQLFHDRLMNSEKARKMLDALRRKYPDHEIIPHVESYLAQLN